MADIVKIVLPSETAENSPVASSAPSAAPVSSGGDARATAQQVVRGAKTILAATGIRAIADNLISYHISTVSLRTGATEYQQKLQFWYSAGMSAASSAAAIGTGFLMGGPVGAGIAAAGVALSYAMKGLNYWENANTIDINDRREEIGIQMQIVRAGAMGRRNGSEK